jgi:tetratricopeptide (TPR) repeat protein
MNIRQAFQLALQHHQSGRLAEAEALYRRILAADPRHAEALHYLGMMACQVGRGEVGVTLIRMAIASKPDYPEAHFNLGNALKDCGHLDEAIAAWQEAIVHRPEYPEAHSNLCIALTDKGRLEEAVEAGQRAVALRPNYPQAHYNLGNALQEKGRIDDAIEAYRQAIALSANFPAAHNNLGIVLKERGRLDEAVAAYRQAIVRKPDFPDAHNNLGIALRDKGRLEEAIDAYRKAVALMPDFPEAHNNLGNALKDTGDMEAAIAASRQAITLKPDFAEAHFNLGTMLLVQGNFIDGWREYEWRWRSRDFIPSQRGFTQPEWDGRPLEGRTLLLHSEQGFGDALQFIRYLPLVARRGARVFVECQEALQRLVQTMSADSTVVARGRPLPPFDVHCPLLSLPRLFATDLASIPRDVPYLHADAAEAGVWRERLADASASLKVGLVWAGRPTHANDRNRTMKLAGFAPLARIPGVRFVSLQKGDAAAEAKSPPEGMELSDPTEELHDFADTAALVAALDLVIAVDTSVVHLAGALGKPVWVLLPFAPDFRWLLGRSDSPWYPTIRLFRQQRAGEWDHVIAEVRSQLEALAEGRS